MASIVILIFITIAAAYFFLRKKPQKKQDDVASRERREAFRQSALRRQTTAALSQSGSRPLSGPRANPNRRRSSGTGRVGSVGGWATRESPETDDEVSALVDAFVTNYPRMSKAKRAQAAAFIRSAGTN